MFAYRMNKKDLISISRWLTGLVVPCIFILLKRDWQSYDSFKAIDVQFGNFLVSSFFVILGAWWATQEEREVNWLRFFTYIAQVSALSVFSAEYTEDLSHLPWSIVVAVTCGTLIASGNHISRRYSPKPQSDDNIDSAQLANTPSGDKDHNNMKSYIYACALAVFGIIMTPLILGSMVIIDEQQNEVAMIDLLTGAFISYTYTTAAIALSYAALIRLRKVKGKWWLNLILFALILFILPLASIVISVSLTEMDLTKVDPTKSGGAKLIGEHMSYGISIIILCFIAGFFIKQPKQVQQEGVSTD